MSRICCEDYIDNYDLAPASWTEDDLRCQEPASGKFRGRWLCEHHLETAMRAADVPEQDFSETTLEKMEEL